MSSVQCIILKKTAWNGRHVKKERKNLQIKGLLDFNASLDLLLALFDLLCGGSGRHGAWLTNHLFVVGDFAVALPENFGIGAHSLGRLGLDLLADVVQVIAAPLFARLEELHGTSVWVPNRKKNSHKVNSKRNNVPG